MMKPLLSGLILALLAACSQTGTLDRGVVPSASFRPVAIPAQVFVSPEQVARFFVGGAPSEIDVGEYPGSAGDQLILFSQEGVQDDSVSALQWRVVTSETEAGLVVSNAGVRQRCARSGSDEWTNSPCP